ncbi:RNA polymerase sigma factor [Halorhodospira halophila]|uniref:RNA polymerase, sigma-24 subunit, RpoE n=1 Tax=Halorhodospira halophila (strain DSM 244 / SL1) TaxID=349124 RepID=A1WU63_HALHL|nr:RNA polymerase sigma factor [Halorhodospira halophila]ABM61225.1 RNA polymerase, sigma-24 subunit, RpoE [Halorhodospira halophila SL1]MBK1730043.1 RNA polymerase sigma factor [Halorhodospira halophila]
MATLLNLWRRRGEQTAFETVIGRHLGSLYGFARRLCGDDAEAEELIQELLSRLYPRSHELLALDQPYPWLARSLHNLWVDRYRRRRARPPWEDQSQDDPHAPYTVAEPGDGPAELVEQALTRERLQRALDALPEAQRSVVILHYVEGFSLDEVAEISAVSKGTLKSRLARARDRLRRRLLDGTESGAGACWDGEGTQ